MVAGGCVGYARAASLMSLVGGCTFGGALIASGIIIQKGHDFEGHAFGAASSAVAAAAMGSRFAKTGKFMPAGAVAALTAVAAAYNSKKASDWS